MGRVYFAYGLRIRSDLSLPELPLVEGAPDVEIVYGRVDPLQGEVKAEGARFRAGERETSLFQEDLGSVLVRDGREIVVDPAPNSDDLLLRSFILDSAMAVLLHQRGLLVMHGSSAALDGGAVIFLGRPGAGKSTTAAALYRRGYAVIGDEVVAIRVDEGGPDVFPSFPRIKLSPQTARSMGTDYESLPRVHPKDEKLSFLVRKGFPDQPLPLRRIYVLEVGGRLLIEAMGPQEAFVEMVRNCYTAALLKASGATDHLHQCGRIIDQVPIRRLTRTADLDGLTPLTRAVEEDLEGDRGR